MNFLRRHKESLLVLLLGFVVFAALNIMMLHYHYGPWTNPRVGFWTAFWNRFEVSGFDPYTYIVISKWRPVYILSRHPLLALMMYPLSGLNQWLKEATGINCAIFIVAVVWTALSCWSWMLTYRINRRILEMRWQESLLLTFFFFSFSHILIITFVEDHMALTLPLILLAVYWGGLAIKEGRTMSLWHSLPLLFVATGVTTTNCVKVGCADLLTRWGKQSFGKLVLHFALYLIPLGILLGLYFYQQETTQEREKQNVENTVTKRAEKDSLFAEKWKREVEANERIKQNQLVKLSIATNTDYKIDRLPSLVENIFGEGLVLHDEYTLKDANKNHRPVLVRYSHWWYYAIEALTVLLFVAGIWCGRKERLMWMLMLMFGFDMLLHVGLNFASADVYIMTAHWAFVIPVAVAFLLKKTTENPRINTVVCSMLLFLTLFMWVHNLKLIIPYILG